MINIMKYEMLYWDGYKWYQEEVLTEEQLLEYIERYKHINEVTNKLISSINEGYEKYIGGHIFKRL